LAILPAPIIATRTFFSLVLLLEEAGAFMPLADLLLCAFLLAIDSVLSLLN